MEPMFQVVLSGSPPGAAVTTGLLGQNKVFASVTRLEKRLEQPELHSKDPSPLRCDRTHRALSNSVQNGISLSALLRVLLGREFVWLDMPIERSKHKRVHTCVVEVSPSDELSNLGRFKDREEERVVANPVLCASMGIKGLGQIATVAQALRKCRDLLLGEPKEEEDETEVGRFPLKHVSVCSLGTLACLTLSLTQAYSVEQGERLAKASGSSPSLSTAWKDSRFAFQDQSSVHFAWRCTRRCMEFTCEPFRHSLFQDTDEPDTAERLSKPATCSLTQELV